MKPRLLDLFCGAGGAAMGYHRAGFDVTGVDIKPQPRYPFTFVQVDAMTYPLDGFDVIHASPPCQDYSRALRHLAGEYPRLIEPVRDRLTVAGVPWIIENVPGAPLPVQSTLFGEYGLELCGTMFGLNVQRHRLFETSWPVSAPRGCDHDRFIINPYNAQARARYRAIYGADPRMAGHWRAEIGTEWMTGDEAEESIPPAFTEYIGMQLITLGKVLS